MKARWPRSSAMRCTCCSAPRANSRTTPRAQSLARSSSTHSRSHSASAGSKRGIALGVTRIGVNAGPAIVGNFGGGRFFDYTAYGDTINIAARLEAANKQLGTRICVSASVAAKVKDFRGRPVGDLVLRGKDGAATRFRAPTRRSNTETPRRRATWRPLPSWKPAIPAQWPHSPRRSASARTIHSPASISSGC